ncbi:MAG TPA: hypothetical protein V6C58_04670 [Allocoleopsis sp.]
MKEANLDNQIHLKMKYLFYLFVLTFLAACTNADNAKKNNDVEKENLYGQVKSIKEYVLETVDSFGVIKIVDSTINYFKLFNIDEKIIEEFEYAGDSDSITSKKTFRYDYRGNIIEEIKFYRDNAGEKKSIQRYIYNYNSNGDISEATLIYATDSLITRRLIKYNNRGKKIEEISYESDGKISKRVIYKYDNKENIVEKISYNSNGKLEYNSTYKHDVHGNEIEETKYNSDGSLEKFKIDKNGNMTERTSYDADGNLKDDVTIKYEIDKNGNWIKKTSNQGSKEKIIVARRIEYY